MNIKAIRIFKAFLKKGWISRADNYDLWRDFEDTEVMDELENLKIEMDFDICRVGNRAYLIPNQENEFFSQDNIDFRRDIKSTSDCKLIDLYLLNYLAIYLLYEFFHGEGSDPLNRDFILKDDFIQQFTKHCEQVQSGKLDGETTEKVYGINFINLSKAWLSKIYGEPTDRAFTAQVGCLNRILIKFTKEELFFVEDEKIIPTQKLKDLMPYFLRKERVESIHQYFNTSTED